MDKINKEKVWRLIKNIGDDLNGKLPHHPNHPNGRNPYAHVALCVREKFSASYKEIPDEKYDEVLDFIEFLKTALPHDTCRDMRPFLFQHRMAQYLNLLK